MAAKPLSKAIEVDDVPEQIAELFEDVDGEGSAFDLTRKRGTTYGRYAMTAVESSPGFVIENPKWTRKTRHEAPPTRGILAVYNRGDRRRWLWPCVVCKEHFEPSFEQPRSHHLLDPVFLADATSGQDLL